MCWAHSSVRFISTVLHVSRLKFQRVSVHKYTADVYCSFSRLFKLRCNYGVNICIHIPQRSVGDIMFPKCRVWNAYFNAASLNMDKSVTSPLARCRALMVCFFPDSMRTAHVAKPKAFWLSTDPSIGYLKCSKSRQLSEEVEQKHACCLSLSGSWSENRISPKSMYCALHKPRNQMLTMAQKSGNDFRASQVCTCDIS